MSEIDRATKVALDAYPPSEYEGRLGEAIRAACRAGYRRALTDAAEWIKKEIDWGDGIQIVVFKRFFDFMTGEK